MKTIWASVKASALMIGLCLGSHLQAEDREQLEALQRSISELQKTLQKGGQEKNLLQNELMSV